MGTSQNNLIVKRTFDFALHLIGFTEILRKSRKFEMSAQLFKSGTSIGANVSEAQNAESNADFIHKFKIAAKEGEETNYWLKLCEASNLYPSPPKELQGELNEIMLIISKIIATSKRRNRTTIEK
ncbi:four helix bundle protein [Robiginitalea sp. M366]|uniref:four helix bundle protein n=1 Tax=Robiginitalea aestuariiviva TaxID=3036903 RepID=UPI00240DAF46|nr:four helix bundle protein [Robiginitalea aestuariiviva]MDG1571421.1 four helix bundle protein [Robiginitalea aestuariiviva]